MYLKTKIVEAVITRDQIIGIWTQRLLRLLSSTTIHTHFQKWLWHDQQYVHFHPRCTPVDKSHEGVLQTKLPAGANRILFVKNLNYNISGEDLYDLFGRYGGIRQIRLGDEAKTKGTAFVVYDDVMDVRISRCHAQPRSDQPFPKRMKAKNALEHLNGFHLQERYIVGE